MKQELAVVGGQRRRHSKEFKARVVAQCKPAGVSVSAVALANGLNANLVRQWLRKFGVKPGSALAVLPRPKSVCLGHPERPPEFIPVPMPAGNRESIRVEVVRGNNRISIDWPVSAAEAAAVWLRDVVR